MIEARGWGWRHAGRREWAVRGLDLQIGRGERVLLLGASGSGKSTLLAGLAGLLAGGGGDEEGGLRVDGRDPRAARDRVGFVFQDPEEQLVMGRVGDEIAFALENRCVPATAIWPSVDAALRRSGLGPDRSRPTASLSGGEQQRLALAAALVGGPALLLLDEPTANLDDEGAAGLRASLRDAAASGATLVLVEHRVEESLDLATRAIVLGGDRGLIADGPPATVFEREGALLEREGVWVPGRAEGGSGGGAARADGGAPLTHPKSVGTAGAVVLDARSASFRYPGAATDAVAGADVALRERECLAVTGPNGSGKTTLALLLGGLLSPASGDVLVAPALAARGERRVWRLAARDLVTRVGSVFQRPERQFVRGRVDDELLVGPLCAGAVAADARARTRDLLERLGLAHLAAANPFTLSGGEQRRLSVGTALATSPSAMILDEPTFGLDRRGYAEVVGLLEAYRAGGGGLCCVTHDRPLLARLADRELRLPPRAA